MITAEDIKKIIADLEERQEQCVYMRDEAKKDGMKITVAEKRAEIYAYGVAIKKLENLI